MILLKIYSLSISKALSFPISDQWDIVNYAYEEYALRKSLKNGHTELVADILSDVSGSSFISKISYSAGQGVANGVLLARLGYGVMEACRSISSKDKRKSFIKTIFTSIVELFNASDQKGI